MEARAIAVRNNELADAFEPAREELEKLIVDLRSPDALTATHSAIEQRIRKRSWEVLRQLMQGHLLLRGSGAVPEGHVIGADGVDRTHCREHDRGMECIFGEVEVTRVGYGARETASLHPLDADLNLPPESYSHGVRRCVAEEVCKVSFDNTVEAIARDTGAHVPKRQVENLTVAAAQDFDEFYALREAASAKEVRQTGSIVVLTSDGKGIATHQEDLRAETRKAAEKRADEQAAVPKPLALGLPKDPNPRRDRKRMATVASVYTIAPFVRTPEDVIGELDRIQAVKAKRPRPEHKRVWASIKHGPEIVLPAAFEEAFRRDPGHVKQWAGLVDGNETQLELLRSLAKEYGVELTIIVDLLHVAQYLWKASFAFHARGTKAAEKWVRARLLDILRGRSSTVAAAMRRSATLRELSAEDRKPVDDCADYLLKYRDFLRYDQYLAAGLPIATGVIEGACRHLVQDRMGITGAIWRLERAEAVLRLRSLHASGDFDEYWAFHESSEHFRNHASRYANDEIPAIIRPALRSVGSRRCHLHAVP